MGERSSSTKVQAFAGGAVLAPGTEFGRKSSEYIYQGPPFPFITFSIIFFGYPVKGLGSTPSTSVVQTLRSGSGVRFSDLRKLLGCC